MHESAGAINANRQATGHPRQPESARIIFDSRVPRRGSSGYQISLHQIRFWQGRLTVGCDPSCSTDFWQLTRMEDGVGELVVPALIHHLRHPYGFAVGCGSARRKATALPRSTCFAELDL